MLDVLLNSLPIFLAIILGYVFARRKIFPKNASDTLATILFKIVGPFLVFSYLYGLEINQGELYLIIVPILMTFTMLAFAIVISKLMCLNGKQLGAAVLCMMLFGAGSIYPFVKQNFSSYVFAEFVTVDIIQFLFFLIVGPIVAAILGAKYGNGKKVQIRSILGSIITDPLLIAMILTFAFTLFEVRIPDFVFETSDFFAESFFMLIAVFVGTVLKFPKRKMLLKVGAMYVLRVCLVILIILGLTFLLSLSEYETQPLYLAFFAQFSVLSVVYSKQQGLDDEFASQMVLFSMIVQLVLYPVAIWVMK